MLQQNNITELESVVLRFAGDSGDGMQVTGTQFTNESALAGNDLATLPDFPAEIRAPAGTLAGVSGFQINFGSKKIFTPGDAPDVLVAMNPAALKANIKDLKLQGTLILNEDAFNEKNLQRVGYEKNPLDDPTLKEKYRVYNVPISKLTHEALKDSGLSNREIERCKNFFTLGLMLWMYHRHADSTISWIKKRFTKEPALANANTAALQAGLTYGEATELIERTYVVRPAKLSPGTYKNINGTTSLAYGLLAASKKSSLPLYFGAYPITPASELLHELAKYKHFGVTTFQAEDEIAAICSVIGASYAGCLAISSSSGPGIALKSEGLGLAVMTELPLVIVDNQRGGPSTGLPTKTEQADLFLALHGRHGEAPVCVLAASSPTTAFTMAYEACRIAVKYMTPVFLLSDSFINNSSEPWAIPNPEELTPFEFAFAKENNNKNGGNFLPYLRNETTLGRAWAIPGTPGLTHRIGGLEKENITGNVSYDGDNHHLMCALRAEKIKRIAHEIPPTQIEGPEKGELLLVGWGGTEGTLRETVTSLKEKGITVSRIHLYHLNPLPNDLGRILSQFRHVLVPEINSGQLRSILRNEFLIDAKGLNLIRGKPIQVHEVEEAVKTTLGKS